MPFRKIPAAFALALAASAAPLPGLRVEATDGGSVLYVRNVSSQPLNAYLIELVGYPGSSFSLWQDDLSPQAVPPGSEKRIPVTNMTVGAAPEYVKVQAALYADGTSSGLPEKVALLIGRRRAVLETTREAIRRIEKAQVAATPKAGLIADLKKWEEDTKPPSGANRNSPAAAASAGAASVIVGTTSALERGPVEDALANLRASERILATSKPPL